MTQRSIQMISFLRASVIATISPIWPTRSTLHARAACLYKACFGPAGVRRLVEMPSFLDLLQERKGCHTSNHGESSRYYTKREHYGGSPDANSVGDERVGRLLIESLLPLERGGVLSTGTTMILLCTLMLLYLQISSQNMRPP